MLGSWARFFKKLNKLIEQLLLFIYAKCSNDYVERKWPSVMKQTRTTTAMALLQERLNLFQNMLEKIKSFGVGTYTLCIDTLYKIVE